LSSVSALSDSLSRSAIDMQLIVRLLDR